MAYNHIKFPYIKEKEKGQHYRSKEKVKDIKNLYISQTTQSHKFELDLFFLGDANTIESQNN